MTKLPKRAASRASLIFWLFASFVLTFIGMSMFADGSGWGLVLMIGSFMMAVRELNLRKKWKRGTRIPMAEYHDDFAIDLGYRKHQ